MMSTKLKIYYCAILAFSLLAVSPLFSIHEDAGTTGFAALKIVFSARANAMGQALTGTAKNPDALIFNPAALLNLPHTEISSTYMNYFIDAQGGAIQYLVPQDKYTAYGFFVNYLNMGEMERTGIDQDGNILDGLGNFGAYTMIGGASLAKHVNEAIDIGGSLKAVFDKIDDATAAAVVIDASMIHHPANQKVKVGLSMRNFGAQILYYSDSDYKEKLPLTFAAGLSYDISPRSFIAIDLNKASGQNFIAKLGYENYIYPSFALRAGFRTDAADWRTGGDLEILSGFSTGVGWNWQKYNLDYSVSSYGDLGFINQVTLKYEF